MDAHSPFAVLVNRMLARLCFSHRSKQIICTVTTKVLYVLQLPNSGAADMGCHRLAHAMPCSWLVPNKQICFKGTSHLADVRQRQLSLLLCTADGKLSLTVSLCKVLCCH